MKDVPENTKSEVKTSKFKRMKYLIILVFISLVSFYIGKMSASINKTVYLYTDTGGDVVEAYGSFIVKDNYGIVLEGKNDPTGVSGHTVDVNCYKDSMICVESQAFIGPFSKSITIGNTKTYNIDQWTNESITTKPLSVDSCTIETLHIDRFSKVVTITNDISNSKPSCASLPPPSKVILTIQ